MTTEAILALLPKDKNGHPIVPGMKARVEGFNYNKIISICIGGNVGIHFDHYNYPAEFVSPLRIEVIG